jgi:hypothetical protein
LWLWLRFGFRLWFRFGLRLRLRLRFFHWQRFEQHPGFILVCPFKLRGLRIFLGWQ